MRSKIKNRGLVGGTFLAAVIILFSAGQYLFNQFQETYVKDVVYSYIQNEMDKEYLDDLIEVDNTVGKILSWEGNVLLRWNGIKKKLVLCESSIETQHSESVKRINAKEIFVLEKHAGKWSVVWHNTEKYDKEE